MLYHTDEKPHSCSVCGRSFKELSTLQNHERIHSGERPFVCETCGKSFRQRVSYLVHRRIHTGVLPYSCEACGRKFRYKVTQRTHKCIIPPASSNNTETTLAPPDRDPEQVIKQNLISLREAGQGRRQFSSRIQNIIAKSANSVSSSLSATVTGETTISDQPPPPPPQPASPPTLSDLQRLCLEDDWTFFPPDTSPGSIRFDVDM